MRFIGLISGALLSAAMCTAPASAQVMARGFYNHVEDRISFFIPEIISADQIMIEEVVGLTTRGGNTGTPPIDHIARRHSYISANGSIYAVTSIDFKEDYAAHHPDMQAAMATAATEFRQRGEVLLDFGTRSDRIPAHLLNIRLPNENILYVLLILHQDDEMDERRLVIAQVETPPRARQPGLFLSSVGIINPEYFGTEADHTFWRVRYTPAGPPIHGQELVATQPWGLGEFEEIMSVGGEAIPD
jgi:hypothetical protein